MGGKDGLRTAWWVRGIAGPSWVARKSRGLARTNERPSCIRVACANVESQLAALLAEHLRKPAEAERALAALFAAPGSVAAGPKAIVVTLQPAGTRNEREASGRLLHS